MPGSLCELSAECAFKSPRHQKGVPPIVDVGDVNEMYIYCGYVGYSDTTARSCSAQFLPFLSFYMSLHLMMMALVRP